MKNLIIEGKTSGKTPTIHFKATGELSISGRSIPEDSRTFYEPVFTWLELLKANLPRKIHLSVKLEYFNTSSSILLLTLFNNLVQLHQAQQTEVKITWIYHDDDDEMHEAGRDYKSILKVPFELVSVKD